MARATFSRDQYLMPILFNGQKKKYCRLQTIPAGEMFHTVYQLDEKKTVIQRHTGTLYLVRTVVIKMLENVLIPTADDHYKMMHPKD